MPSTEKRLEPIDQQKVMARLSGAASLRAEIEHVMSAVADGATSEEFRRAILDDNAARKATDSARMWAWRRLKLRYALDRVDTAEFSAFRLAMRDADRAGRGLSAMLMFARTDLLFRDSTLDLLVPHLGFVGEIIASQSLAEYIETTMESNGLSWSDMSRQAIVNHLASSWKEFGLVDGSKLRRVAAVHPSNATIRFAIELGRAEGRTDRQVLDSIWFRLLAMDTAAVESALFAAARSGALQFRSQADVVEIVLPHEGS